MTVPIKITVTHNRLERTSGDYLIQDPFKPGPTSKLGPDAVVNQAAQGRIQINFPEIPWSIVFTISSVDKTKSSVASFTLTFSAMNTFLTLTPPSTLSFRAA